MAKKKGILQELGDLAGEQWEGMNKKEREVYQAIGNTFEDTDYPPDFFKSKTPEELTEIFGGSGDRIVNAKVHAALCTLYDFELMSREAEEMFTSLPEEDEEE